MRYRKKLPKHRIEINNGGIYLQKVRCGKKNCRCALGKKHSAYYFFTREGGTLTKTYIRKSELERLRQIVNEARGFRRLLRRCEINAQRALEMAKAKAGTKKDSYRWDQERFDFWVDNLFESDRDDSTSGARLIAILDDLDKD